MLSEGEAQSGIWGQKKEQVQGFPIWACHPWRLPARPPRHGAGAPSWKEDVPTALFFVTLSQGSGCELRFPGNAILINHAGERLSKQINGDGTEFREGSLLVI